MNAGAVDFIEKPFDDEVMLSAIRAALARHADDRERDERATAIQERIARLSDREREVLDRLVAGKANKVIAYKLGISPRTVKVYRANVMTKMQADSLSELVRMATARKQRALGPAVCAGSKRHPVPAAMLVGCRQSRE
jgi:two-component system, LuxR family, response regulator FixJ